MSVKKPNPFRGDAPLPREFVHEVELRLTKDRSPWIVAKRYHPDEWSQGEQTIRAALHESLDAMLDLAYGKREFNPVKTDPEDAV